MSRGFVIAFAVAGIAALAVLFLTYFERGERVVDTGFQGPARSNPLLAAERLYTRLGVPGTSVRGLLELPPVDHALVMTGSRRFLGQVEVDRLLAWVEGGGRLLAVASRGLDPLRIQAGVDWAVPLGTDEAEDTASPAEGDEEWLDEDMEDVADAVESEDAGADEDERRVVALRPYEDGPELAVEMTADRLATAANSDAVSAFSAGDGEGAVLVRYPHGAGMITLLTDARFLTNAAIGDHQHATLAFAVLGRSLPAGVWLVYHERPPWLLGLIADHGWRVLVGLAVFLLAWAWYRAARFGPPLPDPPAARRSLLEHVRASGELLWRRQLDEHLLAATRRSVERRAGRRHPAWNGLPPAARRQRLAALSGVDEASLEPALDAASALGDEARFHHLVQTFETVRRSL